MVVIRPNTGRTGQELSTKELHERFRFVKGLKDVTPEWGLGKEEGEGQTEVRSADELAYVKMWQTIYDNADSFDKMGMYAPRKSKVGLVHGSVMHVFPSLDKAVKTCLLKRCVSGERSVHREEE
jgi:hypothetical protein